MNFIATHNRNWLSAIQRVTILIFVGITLNSSALADNANHDEDGKAISVMTQNLFMGTDFPELAAARTFDEFVQAVTITYRNVLATQPAQRMAAIAQEIAKLKPDLVGLQEASIIRTGPSTFPVTVATHVEIDMLDSLLTALENQGIPYKAVAIFKGFDAQAPGIEGFDVRFTVQDVILVRTDRLKNSFKLSDAVVKAYQNQLIVDTAIGPVTNIAGFLSTSFELKGKKFRFVSTHLAVPFFSGISIPFAQSSELIQFLTQSNQNLPTIVVGDFNSSANDPTDPTYATYSNFISAGLTDTWEALHPDEQGFTCCQAPNEIGRAHV